jgi:hypothetical protein
MPIVVCLHDRTLTTRPEREQSLLAYQQPVFAGTAELTAARRVAGFTPTDIRSKRKMSDPIPLQKISPLMLRSIYPPRGHRSRYHVTGACDVATQSTARPSACAIASSARQSRGVRTGYGMITNTVPVPDGWHQ